MPAGTVGQSALGPRAKVAAFGLGTSIASAPNRSDLLIWDIESDRVRYQKSLPPGELNRIRFSPNGRTLAFGLSPSSFIICDALTGQELKHFTCEPTVGDIGFSADGRYASAVTLGGFIYVWDLERSRLLHSFQPKFTQLKSVRFHGSLLVASGWQDVFLYDWKTGQRHSELHPTPHLGVSSAISPDGRTLALGESETITLWSLDSRQLVGRLTGHQEEIRELAFTSDGQLIVSASFDEFRLWRAESTSKPNFQ